MVFSHFQNSHKSQQNKSFADGEQKANERCWLSFASFAFRSHVRTQRQVASTSRRWELSLFILLHLQRLRLATEAAFELRTLISVAACAECVMVSRIALELLVAAMRLLVSCARGGHELSGMSAERICAERIAAQKVFRVSVPLRIVALLSRAGARCAMCSAIVSDANQFTTTRSCARVRRFD